jgi:hypothetical protein
VVAGVGKPDPLAERHPGQFQIAAHLFDPFRHFFKNINISNYIH